MSSRPRPGFPLALEPTLARHRPDAAGSVRRGREEAPVVRPPVSPGPTQSSALRPSSAQPDTGGYGALRQRMVQRLAAQGIGDDAVLTAMGMVERHRFVDTALMSQAYEDTSLPIGMAQTISKPNVVARMLELLRAGHGGAALGRVLEIGTGCGYQAAVLAQLAREVYSIERVRALHERARHNLRFMRIPNLHLLLGDGMQGYAKGAPYAAIIAAAGGDAIPMAWVDQLAVGGCIVAPVAQPNAHGGSSQALITVEKTAQGVRQTVLEAVHFVPLKSGVI